MWTAYLLKRVLIFFDVLFFALTALSRQSINKEVTENFSWPPDCAAPTQSHWPAVDAAASRLLIMTFRVEGVFRSVLFFRLC